MGPSPNRRAAEDPELVRFESYLLAERNVAEHTRAAYLADLAQLVSSKWGEAAEPPFPWKEFSENDARAYLVAFTRNGATATTVRRKLAAARTFCRFLQRSEILIDNPFSLLKGPRKAKTLPKVLSVEDVARFLSRPSADLKDGTIGEYAALRDTAMFEALYSTGCRISEMTPVTWKEIDFGRGTLIVTGKGSKDRLVILGGPAREALSRLRRKVGERDPSLADDAVVRRRDVGQRQFEPLLHDAEEEFVQGPLMRKPRQGRMTAKRRADLTAHPPPTQLHVRRPRTSRKRDHLLPARQGRRHQRRPSGRNHDLRLRRLRFRQEPLVMVLQRGHQLVRDGDLQLGTTHAPGKQPEVVGVVRLRRRDPQAQRRPHGRVQRRHVDAEAADRADGTQRQIAFHGKRRLTIFATGEHRNRGRSEHNGELVHFFFCPSLLTSRAKTSPRSP